MRPSTRLMIVAIVIFTVSMLAIALEALPNELGLWLWGGLGILLLADILISRAGSWAVEFRGPGEVFTNESTPYTLSLAAAGALPGTIRARLAWPGGLDGPEEIALDPSEDGASATVPVLATRRGQWKIERLWLSWGSRLGLVSFCPRLPLDASIAAVPNIRPIQSGQIDVTIQSTLYGIKENMMKGEGSEFHQLRDWVAGMDPRTIDWKQSARHRALVAKEMRAERNHHVILALDNGFLMRERIDGVPKIDHAVNAALACAWAAGVGGDLVGLYAFDSHPRLFIPPEPGRAAFPRLRSRMAGLDYASVETNHTLAMAHLHQRLKRRSLVLVFSDFVDTTTAELLVENITVLNRTHVIIFVALRDTALEAIADAAPAGMTEVASSVAATQMIRERQIVLERLHRLGVFVVDAEPKAVTGRLISTYLNIKSRELI